MISSDGSGDKQLIADGFKTILRTVGYVQDGMYNLDSQRHEVAILLGKGLFNYLVASIYDCDWEGFSADDLRGVSAFLTDLALAFENGEGTDKNWDQILD